MFRRLRAVWQPPESLPRRKLEAYPIRAIGHRSDAAAVDRNAGAVIQPDWSEARNTIALETSSGNRHGRADESSCCVPGTPGTSLPHASRRWRLETTTPGSTALTRFLWGQARARHSASAGRHRLACAVGHKTGKRADACYAAHVHDAPLSFRR